MGIAIGKIAAAAPPLPAPDPADTGIAVRLDGVSKKFGDVTALEETWLKIRRGEFLTLLGPSGCGKSTLLNLLAGFLDADSGEIFINGDLVTAIPPSEREIGIVFQSYALFPHMNVAKNVGYGLRMRGVPKREIAERVAKVLDLVKLGGLDDRRPSQLSGGQQQRVALARALVIRPRVLLLDEPFSALDKNLRASMQVELKALQRDLGITTVFVTHDQSEALSMSDRIAVMSGGRIHQIGTPTAVYAQPADRFVASFIGDVNVIPARLERRLGDRATVRVGNDSLSVRADRLPDVAAGAPLDLFVRPERLALAEAGGAGLSGSVTAYVFQGGHVDVHVATELVASHRLLVRLPVQSVPPGLGEGSKVSVALSSDEVTVFRAEEGST